MKEALAAACIARMAPMFVRTCPHLIAPVLLAPYIPDVHGTHLSLFL